MRLWNEWKAHRNAVSTVEIIPDDITKMSTETLQYWMCRFVLEVRKKDGSVYPASTLHHLCYGVMRHLRKKQAEPLNIDEELLWQTGQLGNHSP